MSRGWREQPRHRRTEPRRDRRRLTVAAAAVVGLAAVGAAAAIVVPRVLGDDDGAEAAVDAEAFLAAWQEGDVTGMHARLADGPASPEELDDQLGTLTDGLQVASATYELGEVDASGSEAVGRFEATLQLAGLGAWSYAGELPLRRLGDEEGWAVEWSPAVVHPDLGEGQQLVRTRERPPRAPITGADGTPLAEARDAVEVGIEPQRMSDPDDPTEVAEALETERGIDPEFVEAQLAQPWVQPDSFVPVETVRADEFEQAVRPVLEPVPGIIFRPAELRGAPTDDFAQHILGRTGEITAELLEELGSSYTVGDEVGLTGLERVFEEQLAGAPTGEVRIEDIETDGAPDAGDEDDGDGGEGDAGDDVPTGPVVLHTFEGRAPQPVATTLDRDVQAAVEAAIDGIEQPAAVVVVDAQGHVRGAASRPLDEFNRAFAGMYPPGSTFKVVTTDALLAAGITPETTVECPETATAGGRQFTNFESSSLGPVPFATAFAESCNTAFVTSVADLTADDLVAAAGRFGFNQDYSLGLSAQGGSFPEPADATEQAAASIGQGRVVASPLHMATIVSTVLDGGWQPPVLLPDGPADEPQGDEPQGDAETGGEVGSDVETGSDDEAEAPADDAVPRTEPASTDPLGDGARETLADLMRRVVTEGSGTAAAVSGRDVLGKTGTAEFGEGDPLPTHAWFIGAAGDLAAAVLIEDGGVGGRDAAPVFAELLAALPPG